MGHPRSGSSLLMHILTANKGVLGFGEYFTIYRDATDLLKAEFDIRRKAAKPFNNYLYIANQVLHSSRTPNLDLIISENIKLLFLIRSPKEALSSMAVITKNKKGKVVKAEIVNEYVVRLNDISKIAATIDAKQWIFISYEDLLHRTDASLHKISHFLSLREPLKSSYSLQKFTQISGDPSANIKRGKIVATNSKQIHFDEKLMHLATAAYQNTLHSIKTNSK